MAAPLILLAAIVPLSLVYVLVPVSMDVYRRFRRKRVVTCPDNGQLAEIQLDACRAGRGALVGAPNIRLKDCTRWPARKGCAGECLIQL